MNDPRQCERCGETVTNDEAFASAWKLDSPFLFLCARCVAQIQRAKRFGPVPKTYKPTFEDFSR